MENWIDLTEYAAKYGVSQSTLRRRIRAKSIEFKLIKGKYFLEDSPDILKKAPLFSRGNNASDTTSTPPKMNTTRISATPSMERKSIQQSSTDELEKLVEENRRLKRQLAEMETFVNALEAELEELQGNV